MFKAVASPFLVPSDGSFHQRKAPTQPPGEPLGKKEYKQRLKDIIDELDELQRVLYAHDRYALLLIFQAMDAAGKDSTIRAVMRGIDPAGCQVFSFKQPSAEEKDHDFLWRTACRLPERGRIGIFNRSYYEEVLIVRVHQDLLSQQKLPFKPDPNKIWQERYASIVDHEKHLARNGTVILKFWLNVSKEEQKARFLARLEQPEKNWKFSLTDVQERRFWDAYMQAYEDALNATSKPWAPWYAIPADDKPAMRLCVAELIVQSLKKLDLRYPTPDSKEQGRFAEIKAALENEDL
jgi:PPK2 family polyphosphate:nucleotide phosphotransferase